ncbi:hypothetical protein [Streptomyces sp. NPDC057253]|uniref:hypothetical protein n=1 Tax=Streptomyces sp. NPDC057253 TaxID=3346069 RepID=UPI00362C33D4
MAKPYRLGRRDLRILPVALRGRASRSVTDLGILYLVEELLELGGIDVLPAGDYMSLIRSTIVTYPSPS